MPYLEITEVVLINCNVGNNIYQQNSRVLYTFVSNTLFAQLLDILAKNYIFLKAFNSEFSYRKLWFTDQNSNPVEINITLVVN